MTNRGWAVPVKLQPDELFSSWLVRSALANGCDPLAFADAIWPKWRIWTIDVDREIPQERLESLVRSSGMSRQDFDTSTLRDVASIISSEPLPRNNFWYWILTLGTRNRRRSGGIQYCPTCLADDTSPYFRKYWRYAWHTACEKHGCILLDRCPSCGAAIQPHRVTVEMKAVVICPLCNRDLRLGQAHAGRDHAIRFQQAADGILSGQKQLLHDKSVTEPEWFAIARFYWDLVRRIMDERTESLNSFGKSVGLPDMHVKQGILSIEQARTEDRHNMLDGINMIMNLSGNEMKMLLKTETVTLQAFCPSRTQLPYALAEIAFELNSMPVTRSRTTKTERVTINEPKPRKTVERMMRKLINKSGL